MFEDFNLEIALAVIFLLFINWGNIALISLNINSLVTGGDSLALVILEEE
jgi:hypothetical protein